MKVLPLKKQHPFSQNIGSTNMILLTASAISISINNYLFNMYIVTNEDSPKGFDSKYLFALVIVGIAAFGYILYQDTRHQIVQLENEISNYRLSEIKDDYGTVE